MHTAARHGHLLMVQALLEEGGDPVCQSKVHRKGNNQLGVIIIMACRQRETRLSDSTQIYTLALLSCYEFYGF